MIRVVTLGSPNYEFSHVKNKRLEVDKYPFVSVLIPVRNGEKHIADCLEHILDSQYPKDRIEILVIDGMSSDRTRDIVKNFMSTDISVYLLDNPGRQRAIALNIGVKAAKGDIVLRLDVGSIIPPDYIAKCIDTLIKTGADNAGGRAKSLYRTLSQQAIGLAMSSAFGIGSRHLKSSVKSGYVNSVYLGCFRREVFDRVGLFNEEAPIVSEDSEMNERIWKAGGKVYLNTDIVAHYYPRDNFRDFWRAYFRYGGARADYYLRTRNMSWRNFVSPLVIAVPLILSTLSLVNIWFLKILVLLLALASLMDLLVSLTLSIRNKKFSLTPRLLLAFPCMYFSHGLGFFKRLLTQPKVGYYWKD